MVAIEAERCTLAAAMLHPHLMPGMACRTTDFTVEAHRHIWLACQTLGAKTDPMTVAAHLDDELPREGHGWLTDVGDIAAHAIAVGNAEHYAKLVRDAAIEREARDIGATLLDTGDVNEAMRDLMTLTRETVSRAQSATDVMKDVVDLVDRVRSGEKGIRTGLKQYDDDFGGLKKTHLIVVGARPKMGKTSFLTTLTRNIAMQKLNVGICSAEQPSRELMLRMVSAGSGMSLHNILRGKISNEGEQRINQASVLLAHTPLHFYDKPGMTIDDIVMQARRWAYKDTLDVLFVDYLQRIRNDHEKEMRLKVGDTAHQLKSLALELKIPIVVLSQVNRAVESRPVNEDGEGRQPYASDLSESAMIEQEADQIVTLYRPAVYIDDKAKKEKLDGLARLFMCANRHGPTGNKVIRWDSRTLQFIDMGECA